MATEGSCISFISHADSVLAEFDSIIDTWLEEASGELEAEIARLSRVDTGQTKDSYKHVVDTAKKEAYIGSNLENAIWEEFGTGEYALGGDGRKGGWWYRNPRFGLNGDRREFVHTYGKTPNRPMARAYLGKETRLISRIQNMFREMKNR